MWSTFDFYYSNMKRERDLQEHVRNQDRKRQQQGELAELDGQLEKLQEEHHRVTGELASSFNVQPSMRDMREAYKAWQGAHEKIKERQEALEVKLMQLRETRHAMVARHAADDRQYEELLAASKPREQLDILLRSIGPSYYVFFACLGVLGWLINQVYNYRDRKKILSRLMAATTLSESLPTTVDALAQCHRSTADLQAEVHQLLGVETEATRALTEKASALEGVKLSLSALQRAIELLRADLTSLQAQLAGTAALASGRWQFGVWSVPREWVEAALWLTLVCLILLRR